MHTIIHHLKEHGWLIVEGRSQALPHQIVARYSDLADYYFSIIQDVQYCLSPDKKQWFLTVPHYVGQADSALRWNEIEQESLETAMGDRKWQAEIEAFWNDHFPIYQSVRGRYEYAAISLVKERYGQVVMGYEPEYETVKVVAESVEAFIEQICKLHNEKQG